MESREVPVGSEGAGQRLDRFLAAASVELSRSRIQALIADGRVQVNGRPAVASRRLKDGDVIRLELPAPRVTKLVPEAMALRIVHEDEWILVIEKPAGLVVHPGAGVSTGTMVHALLHHDPSIADVGGPDRPGIVHRLDRETSGLLVVARTSAAYRALVDAIKQRAVRRTYLALAWGDPREAEGVVDAPIGRDPHDRKKMAVVKRGGRPARTHWRVRERFGLATFLEVELETGRTHQIRVHLAHRRHPVVGDPAYGGRAKKLLSLERGQRSLAATLLRGLRRQALHAWRLEFVHPGTGSPVRYESALPHDISTALDLLRASRARARA